MLVIEALASGTSVYAREKLPAEQISVDISTTENRTQAKAESNSVLAPVSSDKVPSTTMLPTGARPSESSTLTSETSEPSQEQFVYPAEHHLWTQFPIGSWRKIEITTETFDDSGNIYGRSVTTQKETLKALADDSYVLEIEATVEVSGRQIVGPINTRILRLLTDRLGVVFSTTRRDDEIIVFNDRSIECQVWDVLYGEEAQNLRDRIYYTPEKFPYVLRRETFEEVENLPVGTTPVDVSSVIAEYVPMLVDNQLLSCVCEKSTRLRDKGSIQSIRMLSPKIPGGEVHVWSTDFNIEAKPNRWSVLKLLKYGVNSTAIEAVKEH